MSKSIDTLIPDIMEVFEKGVPLDAVPFQTLAEYGTNVTKHFADTVLHKEEHQVKKRAQHQVYASELGHPCAKHVVYKAVKYYEGGPHQDIKGKDAFKFMYGDWIEETVLTAAKIAGHTVEYQQRRVEDHAYLPGTLSGRIDAVIDGVLVDVKSIQHQGFLKLGKVYDASHDTFGYNYQLAFYRKELIQEGIINPEDTPKFLFVSKQSGDMKLVDMDQIVFDNIVPYINARMWTVSNAHGPDDPVLSRMPDVVEGASGNRKLGTVCKYCPFKQECWPGLRTFIYSTGPEYLTVVKKEPKVYEATGNLSTIPE